MLKIAVIGIGNIGFHHARILSSNTSIKLVGISDIDENKAFYAKKFNTNFFKNYQDLPNELDAVIISTPTSSHYEISKFFLNKNIHIFVEKSFTDNLEHAINLINLADKKKLIIQIGLIEKFNPAFIAFKKFNKVPNFIQAIRVHPFIKRCLDVDIVNDLMIHDIDLILNLLNNSNILEINAYGYNKITNSIDYASVNITFDNNCSCLIKASRIDVENKRIMNIFQENCFYSLNFADQSLNILKPILINSQKVYFKTKIIKNNKIELIPIELDNFINAIINNNLNVINSAKNTFRSLELALKIRDRIYYQLNK